VRIIQRANHAAKRAERRLDQSVSIVWFLVCYWLALRRRRRRCLAVGPLAGGSSFAFRQQRDTGGRTAGLQQGYGSFFSVVVLNCGITVIRAVFTMLTMGDESGRYFPAGRESDAQSACARTNVLTRGKRALLAPSTVLNQASRRYPRRTGSIKIAEPKMRGPRWPVGCAAAR